MLKAPLSPFHSGVIVIVVSKLSWNMYDNVVSKIFNETIGKFINGKMIISAF
jgi:hypothetical protein